MYLCIYVSMCICIYVSMYLCIYVSMYLCMYDAPGADAEPGLCPPPQALGGGPNV